MSYEQFAGNVIVIKASDANAVIMFCCPKPPVQYSLVLSKYFPMNETELQSIHRMMTNLNIPPPVDSKRYCKNRAAYLESAALLLVLCFISVFVITLREG